MTDQAIQPTGIKAVVQDADKFEQSIRAMQRGLDGMLKSVKGTADQSEKSSKKLTAFDKILHNAGASLQGFLTRVQAAAPGVANFAGELIGLVGAAGPVGVVIAAAAAATAGFMALGERGAGLVGIKQAFEATARSIGLVADALLGKLRQGAAGTIADFSLMKTTNLALAGATDEVARKFASSLPKILEIARAQSKATGEGVEYLFDSLVRGIKRGSPLLIDNTGLVISEGKANEQYAKSLGKTVDQLSAQEKQVALMNAVLEAGQRQLDRYGSTAEGAATKGARFNTTITNLLDNIAVAIQPAYSAVLDFANNALGALIQAGGDLFKFLSPLTNFLGGIINALGEGIGAIFNAIGRVWAPIKGALDSIFSTISSIAATVFPIVQSIAQAVIDLGKGVLGTVGNILGGVIGEVLRVLKWVAEAGAKILGAFANGLLWAYNNIIAPVLLWITQGIADLLMGHSPPKKGPLSKIDQGGQKLMEAWVEGMAGVSLAPVSEVAADVQAALGGVASMTLPQVKARITELDSALQPFKDQLDIVKASFEAIAKPAEEAFKAIDRQTERALSALTAGAEGSAELVRQLDAQRGMLQDYVDQQQEAVDLAQLQLALAEAQQGQERTLLGIRERMLPVAQAVAEARQGEAKKEEGGAGAAEIPPGAAEIPAATGGQKQMTSEEIARMNRKEAELSKGIEGENPTLALFGIDKGSVEQARQNTVKIKNNVADIGKGIAGSELVKGIKNVFGAIFDRENKDSIAFKLEDFLDSIGNPKREGSIPYFFTTKLPEFFSNVGPILDKGLVQPFKTKIEEIIGNIRNFFTGAGPGTLSGFLDTAVDFFKNLPQRIADVLGGLADILNNVLVQPFLGLIDGIVGGVEGFINQTMLPALKGMAKWLRPFFDLLGKGAQLDEFLKRAELVRFGRLSNAGKEAKEQAASAMAQDNAGKVPGAGSIVKTGPSGFSEDLAKIPPNFKGFGRRQHGGSVAAGTAYLVGEKMAEIFIPRVSGQIMPLGRGALASPGTAYSPGRNMISNDYSSQDNSSVFNMYGVQNGGDAYRRYAAMSAMRRPRR